MQNKRGSHVGMILSFVIFVTFIVFLYGVIKPMVNTGEDKKTILKEVETSVIKNISANFTSTSISISSANNPSESCVSILGLLLIPELTPPYIKVKNSDGVLQPNVYYQEQSPTLIIDRTSQSDAFFKVYSSPEWDLIDINSGDGCASVEDANYQIGTIRVNKYAFEKNIEDLKKEYENHYEELKTNLNIPVGNEFGFSFRLTNGTKIETTSSLKSANVYADETPVQYIDSDANIQSGFLTIKVW
ncbi:Uncharacterised protein [uncultured archaeon]|nr:Uncharacterised protein [uncultured archaeon]